MEYVKFHLLIGTEKILKRQIFPFKNIDKYVNFSVTFFSSSDKDYVV